PIAAMSPERVFIGQSTNTTTPFIRRLDLIDDVVHETSIQTNNRIEALAVGPDNLLYALQMSSPISIHRFTLDLEHADGGTAFQTLPGNASASADSAMTFDGDTLYVALGNAGGILRLD